VSAVGESPLAYQWRFNGAPLTGQTSAVLSLASIQAANAGEYAVLVTNSLGSVLSLPATLTVASGDSDGDGLPDEWEQANGLNPYAPDAGLDPDHDGATNLQEFLAGTNPTNAGSVFRLQVATVTPYQEAVLWFTAVSNRSYSLLSSDAAAFLNWVNRTNIPAAASNRVIWLTNAAGGAQFYRLLTPQLP